MKRTRRFTNPANAVHALSQCLAGEKLIKLTMRHGVTGGDMGPVWHIVKKSDPMFRAARAVTLAEARRDKEEYIAAR